MSKLPPQEEKDFYTMDEMQHVIAREVMKHRLETFEQNMSLLHEQFKEGTVEVKTALATINENLKRQYSHISEVKAEIKREIDKDYVSEVKFITELAAVEKKVTQVEVKIDKQWIKISSMTSVSVIMIGAVAKVLGFI